MKITKETIDNFFGEGWEVITYGTGLSLNCTPKEFEDYVAKNKRELLDPTVILKRQYDDSVLIDVSFPNELHENADFYVRLRLGLPVNGEYTDDGTVKSILSLNERINILSQCSHPKIISLSHDSFKKNIPTYEDFENCVHMIQNMETTMNDNYAIGELKND
jgi:hypothetical protein